MSKAFAWDQWNTDHIEEHAVSQAEAEFVVENAMRPYPRPVGERKWLVRGQTAAGRHLQVIYIVRAPGIANVELDYEEMTLEDILQLTEDLPARFYVIHARDLTRREKLNYRRSR
jgi:uncharacterized DUF497 family protein